MASVLLVALACCFMLHLQPHGVHGALFRDFDEVLAGLRAGDPLARSIHMEELSQPRVRRLASAIEPDSVLRKLSLYSSPMDAKTAGLLADALLKSEVEELELVACDLGACWELVQLQPSHMW